MKTITSRQNEEIKQVSALHSPKGREEQRKFIAEGIRAISTFIDNGFKPVELYVTQPNVKHAQNLTTNHFITLVEDHVMEKLSTLTTPSGFVGVFEIPKQEPLSALTGGLVMTKIADPGNMGSLIRSCAAFGVKTVVTIEGADVWSPKVVQASAGTLALVNVFETNWKDLMRYKKDLKLCALVVDGGKKPAHTTLDNTLLVVGNEAQGIPQEWVAECEETMTISMPGQVESLNAAVAGSIALYLAFVGSIRA